MVKLGLTPLQAIQDSAPSTLLTCSDGAARSEHWNRGPIGVTSLAVDGDPLKDVTTLERVKFVMKGGEVDQKRLREVTQSRVSMAEESVSVYPALLAQFET